jgi:hypothetical protein
MVINRTIHIGKNREESKLYRYISVDYKGLFNLWLQRDGIYSYKGTGFTVHNSPREMGQAKQAMEAEALYRSAL